ncbi:hypothetical protein B9G55_16135 [Saccharibacillus sp. O16]|nr:hypothetical protein B9G55_16135 [Saccharibacillus sp. O16]
MNGQERNFMKLTSGIKDLALTTNGNGASDPYHAVLLVDEDGLTLVDAGLPGMYEQIVQRVEAAGLDASQIKRILFTHQDLDHIGTLPQLLEHLPEAEIWAHRDEQPYLEGKLPHIKITPSRLESMPPQQREAAQRMLDALVPGRVTRVLEHGEKLPLQGGMIVLHTPGHTPGHISLYVPEEKLLIAGDALRVVDGELAGPAEAFTPDMKRALQSLEQLLELEIDRVFCYHGGMYEGNVHGALRQIMTRS